MGRDMSTSVELKHLAVAVASVLPVIFRVLPQGVFGRHIKFWRSPALLAEPLTAPLEGSEDSKLLGQAHFLHSQLCLCPRGPKLWRWVPGSPEIRDEQKKWLTRLDSGLTMEMNIQGVQGNEVLVGLGH